MRKKIADENDSGNKSIKKVILYCLVVLALIIISLCIRFIFLLRESSFDGNSRFTIVVTQQKSLRVISFDPTSDTISSLLVNGKVPIEPPQRIVGIPIDAVILPKRSVDLTASPADAIFSMLWHPTDTKEHLTNVDLVRLYLFAKTVSLKNIQTETLTLPQTPTLIDKLSAQLFSDTKMIDDNLSIEIVNGTDVPGMASRLERLIDNSGGNVVAVSSSHGTEKQSKIYYYQKPSYTSSRLERMLGYETAVTNSQGIAEIKIIIGEDEAKTKKF